MLCIHPPANVLVWSLNMDVINEVLCYVYNHEHQIIMFTMFETFCEPDAIITYVTILVRSCLEKQVLLSFKIARKLKRENLNSPSCNITTRSFRMGSGMLIHSCEPSVMTRPQSYWIQRRHSLPVTSEESSMQSKDLSLDVEEIESAEELLAEPLSSEQVSGD